MDRVHGLRVVPQVKTLKVTKSLYISVDLPKSVQREEILAVPVVVYNRLNRDIVVSVTLHNTEQKFQFAEISNQVNGSTKRKQNHRQI